MKTASNPRTLMLAAGLCLVAASLAHADSTRMLPRDMPASYMQECGSCHTAYPPGMLQAHSWKRIMGGLEQHYGTDASLDAATLQKLSGWLQVHAGTYKRVDREPPEDRITRSAWFERKHRKIEAPVWKLASVKSAANCGACHSGADQGDYDDDSLQFPAGLDARHRRAWND